MTLAGTLNFNPLTDSLKDKDGNEFKLAEPRGDGLPKNGYDPGRDTYQAPPNDRASVEVAVDPNSDRLQILQPFEAWDGKDAMDSKASIVILSFPSYDNTSCSANPHQGSGKDYHRSHFQ